MYTHCVWNTCWVTFHFVFYIPSAAPSFQLWVERIWRCEDCIFEAQCAERQNTTHLQLVYSTARDDPNCSWKCRFEVPIGETQRFCGRWWGQLSAAVQMFCSLFPAEGERWAVASLRVHAMGWPKSWLCSALARGTDIHGRGGSVREDAKGDLSVLGLGQGWDSGCCNPPATGCCKRGGVAEVPWGRCPFKVLGLLVND